MSAISVVKNLYRVEYFLGERDTTSYVVASSPTDAVNFLGAMQTMTGISVVAQGVEVVGVDKAHSAIPAMPVTVGPPPEVTFTPEEVEQIKKLLAENAAK